MKYRESDGIHEQHFTELSFADTAELLAATGVVRAALGHTNVIAGLMEYRAEKEPLTQADLNFDGESARQIRRAISTIALGLCSQLEHGVGATEAMQNNYHAAVATAQALDVQTATIALYPRHLSPDEFETLHEKLLASERQRTASE